MKNSTDAFYEQHIYPNGRAQMIFHPRMHRETHFTALHWHDRPEFSLVLEGTLGMHINGELRTYHAGEIAIVSPNEIHNAFAAECDSVVFHCMVVDKALCPHEARYPERSSSPAIIPLFHQLNDELFREKEYRPEAMNGLAMAIAAMLASEGYTKEDTAAVRAKEQLVRNAIKHMHLHFSSPLTLEDISRAVGVSKYYLSHLFREFAGQSIVEHLNYVRCINARSMLSAGACNVEQAAFQSGFNSLSYFSKTYRSIMGHPPSVDLKKHGETRE